MRVLYIDSVGGLAGDMFLAAALDASLATLEELQEIVTRWLPEPVRLSSDVVTRSAMRARSFQVALEHHHEHHHRNLAEVELLLDRCPMTATAIRTAKLMFGELARAEAKVHGVPLEAVHFHEVGATDSLVDFALAAFVLDRVGAKIEASPALAGRGFVKMQHGLWPVPPPGTAEILREGSIPIRAVPEGFPWENAELTTPTGACLLRRASRYGDPPSGRLAAIGVGAGSVDIPGFPSVVRLLLYEAEEGRAQRFDSDHVAVLETWLDDFPGNLLADVVEELVRAGAFDAAVSPATFKKGRSGFRVEVLASPERADALAAILLGRTTSIGLRVRESLRWKLFREETRTSDGLPAKLARDADGRIARLVPETEGLVSRSREGGPAPLFGWRVEDKSGGGEE